MRTNHSFLWSLLRYRISSLFFFTQILGNYIAFIFGLNFFCLILSVIILCLMVIIIIYKCFIIILWCWFLLFFLLLSFWWYFWSLWICLLHSSRISRGIRYPTRIIKRLLLFLLLSILNWRLLIVIYLIEILI